MNKYTFVTMRDPLKYTKIKEEVAVDEQIKTFEVTEKQVFC